MTKIEEKKIKLKEPRANSICPKCKKVRSLVIESNCGKWECSFCFDARILGEKALYEISK